MCLSTTRRYFLTVSWSLGCSVSTRGREEVVSVRRRVSIYHLVRDGFFVGVVEDDGRRLAGFAILFV